MDVTPQLSPEIFTGETPLTAQDRLELWQARKANAKHPTPPIPPRSHPAPVQTTALRRRRVRSTLHSLIRSLRERVRANP